MRLFIAVELPDGIRTALANLQQDLRSFTAATRWVAPDSIHVTLKFLGEVSENKMEDIHGALKDLAWKPFTVTVHGVGFFPGNRSPRIFWAGMDAPTMRDLAQEVDSRMERLGFEAETRAFRPHITLARAKNTRLEPSLVAAAAPFEQQEFGSFVVDRVYLYRSTLKASGAVYDKLQEYLL